MAPKPVPAPCAPADAPVPVPDAQLPPPPRSVPQKRKADTDADDADDPAAPATPSSADLFDSGRVICESCGQSVLFRDESAAFTTKHWDAHRAQCAAAAAAATTATDPAPPPTTSTTAPDAPADLPQPSKRRRAKRSEEERIDYLRSDPYVAQFEPYRVLCASCDKWIRLRPNSTYCSIPWDAHRKSCLAKKGTKSAAGDDRNAALLADPDVKKFDQERVHCRLCNKWVSVGSDDRSLQSWSAHRAACQQSAGPAPRASAPPSVPPPSSHQLALASMPALVRPPPPAAAAAATATTTTTSPAAHAHTHTHTHTPSPPAPSHESRRRNAAQRAAQLRADPLLAAVEPARVFCALCRKWVQLRQDSSFCAYPWHQHRAKCLLRHQRKAADAADGMPPSVTATAVPDGSGGGSGNSGGSPDSEPDADDSASEDGAGASLEDAGGGAGGDAGGGGALSLADLDSPSGRVRFVARSLRHLFATTYERSDELTLAALVSYLNAAMPPDKHEDFDTAEVSRAALALHAAGAVALAGDVLRPAP
ncbi:hypothetical protein HETIRDRAFT_453185 [Heterobasidion irregulare TC 32-1]|uniref:Uncharacterized protein n=1 Tax=Heterobasidion irregulare (strain TC 32-1) TaxID=747525 RepID=W4JYB3_HETIT|nr:uncharacterized protein HETIRDRAFT_453185 [Heterobasidion irregulare TC 32-1]ETW78533.1 hypothetical protein HETIRDRAFT_453185 [Heterobasidion irregulare TC 32-1]